MRKVLGLMALLMVAGALGAAAVYLALRPNKAALPDPPALLLKVREVAKLEALEVTAYKKISFSPEPMPQDSLWAEVAAFARETLFKKKGKAIVFATLHLGLDLAKLDAQSLRVVGDRVEVVLPPIEVSVELEPGETEIIGSNLDSAQTAQLFDRAKRAFEYEARMDRALRERARRSAEHALEVLLLDLGFREVKFFDALPQIQSG